MVQLNFLVLKFWWSIENWAKNTAQSKFVKSNEKFPNDHTSQHYSNIGAV